VYSALEQANQHIFLAERNLQEHQKIYDEIKGKVEKGVSSKADLAQITSRFSSSQSALLIARRELFDLQAQFFSVVGREPGQLVAPVIDRKLLPATLDDALVLARSNHPQIQSAQADVNAVQQELRAANSGYYPTISLDAEVYHNDNYGGFDGHDNGSRVMLNMRYNLFNGFKTTNKAKASGWRYREAHAIKDQAIIRNVENAKMAWNAAQYLKQQEEVLKVNVDAAVATDDGYRKQFNIGRRTLLDVLDAKIEVYLARRNYLNTRYDRLLSEYRLANAMGILMYALRIDYPEQWKEGE
jgi:adhesin transport system outer membrane protein